MPAKTLTTTDAPTLADLADMLNASSNARSDWERETMAHDEGTEIPRVDELYDVASLPTYGGDEPGDTMGIWSWDETSLLYADGNAPCSWYVSPRVDAGDARCDICGFGSEICASKAKNVDAGDARCDICGADPRHLACVDCGETGVYTDCGHYAQPRPIASCPDGELRCADCWAGVEAVQS